MLLRVYSVLLSDYVALEYEQILQKTAKAVRIQFLEGQTEWIPLSQARAVGEVGDHDGIVHITKWFAEQKGL